MKFRSSTGRSVIWCESNDDATSARSVLRTGEKPVTVTLSLTSPIAIRISSVVCVSTLTRMSEKTALLKPASSAFTS